MSFLERSRIPVWIVPAGLVAKAVRDRGLQLEDLVDQADEATGVLLRTEIGGQVVADAVTHWQAALSTGAEIPFQVQFVAQTSWCWAAVTLSVARYYNTPTSWRSQCQLVNNVLNKGTCCGNGDSAECNVP